VVRGQLKRQKIFRVFSEGSLRFLRGHWATRGLRQKLREQKEDAGDIEKRSRGYAIVICDASGSMFEMAYACDDIARLCSFAAAMTSSSRIGLSGWMVAMKTNTFDSKGRLERTTNDFNGSYVRYEYPPEQNVVKTFTTITEGQGEAYSATYVDGHGRTRISISDLPNAPSETATNPAYSAVLTEY
jgi:hypothetical protein